MIPHPGRAEQRFRRRWPGPLPASGSELMSVATGAQGKVMHAIRPFLLLQSPEGAAGPVVLHAADHADLPYPVPGPGRPVGSEAVLAAKRLRAGVGIGDPQRRRRYRELRWPMREVGALLEISGSRAFHPGRSARSHLAARDQL